MPKIIWHPDALEDVSRLYDFLASASPSTAQRVTQIIGHAADKIAENPGIGTPRANFREWPAKFGRSAYILRYYDISKDEILTTRIWHSREFRTE